MPDPSILRSAAVVQLPQLPRGGGPDEQRDLVLRRDKALAALVISKGITLQEAADQLGAILDAVDGHLEKLLPNATGRR